MIGFWRGIGASALLIAGLAACHFPGSEAVTASPTAPERIDGVDPVTTSPPSPTFDWAGARDCLGMLSVLKAGLDDGRILDLDDTPFLLIGEGPVAVGGRRSAFGGSTDAHAGVASAQSEARCVLRVGRASDQQSDHKVLGREQMRSRYQSGTRAEKNPAYDVAKTRLRKAEKDAKPGKSSIVKVGDPLLDLVGIVVGGALTGLGQWGAGDQLEEALDELMATPPSIDHPVYKSYHFERARVRASREATVPVTLTDRRLRQSWQASMRRLENRDLFVLTGLDRQDEAYARHSEGSVTEDGLQQWLAEAPSPSLNEIAAILLDRSSQAPIDRVALSGHDVEAPAPISDDQTLDAAALPAPQLLQAGHRSTTRLSNGEAGSTGSRIRVIGEKAEAEGVFIASRFILTPSEVIGERGLVDIEDRPGHVALGLVAAVDHGLGLALIQAPLSGRPIAVGHAAPTDAKRKTSRGKASNAPILVGGELIGFTTTTGLDIEGDAIRSFLDKQRHLLPVEPR